MRGIVVPVQTVEGKMNIPDLIKGEPGAAYIITDADYEAIAEVVVQKLTPTLNEISKNIKDIQNAVEELQSRKYLYYGTKKGSVTNGNGD